MSLRCTTCGVPLEGRSICPSCGTLVGAELALAKFQMRAQTWIDSTLSALPRTFSAHHFLWACAVMPIFLIPPAVSLVAAVSSLRRTPTGQASHVEWLAMISALNIVLSLLILYKFHFSPTELFSYVSQFFWGAV